MIGKIFVVSLILTLLWLPLAWSCSRWAGVTGQEMAEINPPSDWPKLAAAVEPVSRDDWLSLVYGKPVGDEKRFVFVPKERIYHTDHGYTLIRFDRASGEEMLQARTLFNISKLFTGVSAVTTFVIFLVWRRRQRQ